MKDRETQLVIVGALKGGAGKSTMTSMIANHISEFYPQLKIAVVDAEIDQSTLYDQRQSELGNEGEKEPNRYDMLKIPSDVFARSYVEDLEGKYDLVFVDLPGTIRQKGVLSVYLLSSVIFLLTDTGPADFRSYLKYVKMLEKNIVSKRTELGYSTEIYSIFNKTPLQDDEAQMIKDGLKNKGHNFLFNNVPYHKATFKDNYCWKSLNKNVSFPTGFNTTYAYRNHAGRLAYFEIAEEMLSIILEDQRPKAVNKEDFESKEYYKEL